MKPSEVKELVADYIAEGGDPRFPPPELTSTVPSMLAQRAAEGPNPDGVATKLRRERDEAREEREKFRGQIQSAKIDERNAWDVVRLIADAYSHSNFTSVPQDMLDRVFARFCQKYSDWDSYKDYLRAGRPDLNEED